MSTEALTKKNTDRIEVFMPPPGGIDLSSRPRKNPAGRMVYWLLALIILALGVLTIGLWFRHQQLYVTTNHAIVRGHITQLGTRLSAVVAEVHVEDGERVARGDILVTLEAKHLRAKAEGAKAELARLERDLEVELREIEHQRRLLPERDLEGVANLKAAQAEVAAAQIRVTEAKEAHRVQESLWKDEVASAEIVREARAKWEEQVAALEASQARLAALQASENRRRLDDQELDIRAFRVGALREEIQLAKANLQLAEADMAATVIRAPEAGAIVRRIVQPGGSIEAGMPTLIMQLGDALWVEAWVDEADVALINEGSPAVVTFASFPRQEFTGKVESIGTASDYEIPESEVPKPRYARMQSNPVVNVRIALDAPPDKLRPGLSAVVAIKR